MNQRAMEQTPAQALEAENSVIDAILLDNSYLGVAAQIIDCHDFFSPNGTLGPNGVIFREISQMVGAGQKADPLTLCAYLRSKDLVDAAGGPGYIDALTSGAPKPHIWNVAQHAELIKEKSRWRNAAHVVSELQRRIATPGTENLKDIIDRAYLCLGALTRTRNGQDWREMFHKYDEFQSAPPLRMAIRQIIQLNAATAIGALAGHGKTWLQLSIGGAMLRGVGTKLWGTFEVLETIPRVLYLIPESTLGPFAHRVKALGLLPFVEEDRLLVRTLSMGRRPSLSDPLILEAAKGAYVMLDTLVRFGDGSNEDSAGEFQVLADAILALMGAGAIGVSAAHHAPKSFANAPTMTLEGVLRGTGDIGAVFATVFGVKQVDAERNILHLENVKSRDFEPTKPFELVGRPFIDTLGDFEPHKRPGECGTLSEEHQPERDGGGASVQAREAKAANLELLRRLICEDPHQSSIQLSQRFHSMNIKLGDSAIRKYRKELGL